MPTFKYEDPNIGVIYKNEKDQIHNEEGPAIILIGNEPKYYLYDEEFDSKEEWEEYLLFLKLVKLKHLK